MKIYSFNQNTFLLGSNIGKNSMEMKNLLGGKGYGLHEMCAAGMPVPPGFTMTTEWSVAYNGYTADEREGLLGRAMEDMGEHLKGIEKQLGYMPLLSVRSGAPVSMPGMMDTILNVGLTDDNFAFYADRYGTRTAFDSYRRLIQMMGCTAFDVDHKLFENELIKWRIKASVETDAEIPANYLEEMVAGFKEIFRLNTGMEFPQNAHDQIRFATRAVFDSWSSDRAVHYRKMENIDSKMGTAVNIQAMVFGNMNDHSGTGVFFTRNPTNGDKTLYGEYLTNAQGEDVVAGIRTPIPVEDMKKHKGWLAINEQLHLMADRLEKFYGDMVDGEFTVEDGKFYILQSRVGKRTPIAAIQIAMDLIQEGLRDAGDLPKLVKPKQYLDAQISVVDPSCKQLHDLEGIPACPGVVTGVAMFSAEAAVNCKEPCILVTKETTPDDIAGMDAAKGILTAMGGATSHAAVVARAMNRPCVVGATRLVFLDSNSARIEDEDGKTLVTFSEGDRVTICGQTGRVWVYHEIPVVDLSQGTLMKDFEDLVLQGASDMIYGYRGCVLSSTDFSTKSEMKTAILESLEKKELRLIDTRTTEARLKEMPLQKDWFLAMGYTVEEPDLDFSEFDLAGVIVLSENDASMETAVGAGAKIMAEAKTVDDLISGKGSYMSDERVKLVFGTKSALKKVKTALKLDFMDQVSPVPVKVAVMEILGGN